MATAENSDDKCKELASRIKDMAPAAKLRLAADLLETKKRPEVKLGHTIAKGVVDELGLVLTMATLLEAKGA